MTRRTTRNRNLAFDLDVNEDTKDMSTEALICRSRGHKWGERGMTRKHYNELISQGIMEDRLYCENGCGWTWTITFSLRNGAILDRKRECSRASDYAMPKGRGRLARDSARVARVARQLTTA